MHRKDRCVSVGEERALVRPLRLTAVSSAQECEHEHWHRGIASSNSQVSYGNLDEVGFGQLRRD